MKNLPKLVTFDGEARSGKGTIVQAIKDLLRDKHGQRVMLVDAGQVFRSLVVAADRAGVDMDDRVSIDTFLGNDLQTDVAVQLVKEIYHMPKQERDELLYTDHVSASSAKIGARPLAQDFKDALLRKWLLDAHEESFDIVLLDGRALEEVGVKLEGEGLCSFVVGFYFISDPLVGARRTLGYAEAQLQDLPQNIQDNIRQFAGEISERNRKDRERTVQPIKPPAGVEPWLLPDAPPQLPDRRHPILLVDTSRDMSRSAMVQPVADLVVEAIKS